MSQSETYSEKIITLIAQARERAEENHKTTLKKKEATLEAARKKLLNAFGELKYYGHKIYVNLPELSSHERIELCEELPKNDVVEVCCNTVGPGYDMDGTPQTFIRLTLK